MTLARPFIPYGAAVLLSVVGGVLVACDSGPSKQDAQSQQLSGTWEVLCVYPDNLGCKQRDVRLEIEDGTGRKSYRFVREEEDVIGRGKIETGASNRLQMTGDFASLPLLWRFDFGQPTDIETDVRLILKPRSGEEPEEVLDMLGISGGRDHVEIDLRRPSS